MYLFINIIFLLKNKRVKCTRDGETYRRQSSTCRGSNNYKDWAKIDWCKR